jgi:hypothetical protein
VIDMTRSALISPLGSEFDSFLFALIGVDRNGEPVSVLSALARSDADPWEEAAELAQLPKETATRKLASLIAILSDARLALPDPATTASRLIALLPCRASSQDSSSKMLPGVGAVTHPPAVAYVIHWVILIVVMLVVQWLSASRQAPAPVDKAPASVPSTVPR